jgi:Ca2+-binding RTX toxin-like protein
MKIIDTNKGRLSSCRRTSWTRRWAVVTMIQMIVYGLAPGLAPRASAQTAPVGAGFVLEAGDLRFIYRQIRIAEAHAAGGQLFGPDPVLQVNDPRFPFGLRTVDGSFNHLLDGTTRFGSSDQVFPRLTTPLYRPAEALPFDPDGDGPLAAGDATSYEQKRGTVVDSQPRVISNLIVDQTAANPTAVALAGVGALPDHLGSLPIGNTAPDAGLSAPFNGMFTFFGQFFDHGLDLVNKGGGTVYIPVTSGDSLFRSDSPSTNFMALTRATNLPGPDGIAGDNPATAVDESADDIREATNQTTPFVDQNQTYTSHPSHQVFLREYVMSGTPARPVATGRMIDGGGLINGVPVKNIGNWGEVKAQARAMLGIDLVDTDVLNVPLLETDPYGRFLRGPNGFPLMQMVTGPSIEGNPLAPITTVGAKKTGHAFLDDIAHTANPANATPQNPHDGQLLNAHFCTGDGRGNENIALTSVHTVFHAEHNRLRDYIDGLIHGGALTPTEVTAWEAQSLQPPAGSGWGYGERLFQAARFVTEMQYQHLVFEEFARKVSPSINPFIGDGINFHSDTNPAITAEFAHQVYRLGHSMLVAEIGRTDPNGQSYDIPLLDAFLKPLEFNRGRNGVPLTAAQAAGAVFQGGTRQVGNEIDEFVIESVRSRLVGLPLDLAVLNLARGRSEGIPPLNAVRRQLYAVSGDPAMAPYDTWFDFSLAMRNPESVVNFIAAYGTSPTLTNSLTMTTRRAAAAALAADTDFMFASAATTGVEKIDLWMGGLAEKPNPFGGLLGSTFNYIFETQLENLQNSDRFYYLERLDGLNLLSQLEGNTFAELIARNTTLQSAASDIFSRPDLVFEMSKQNPTGPIVDDLATTDVDERNELLRTPTGAIRYAGDLHVIWNGRNDATPDRIISSEGDDTLRGNGGDDVMEGGAGNDQHIGGAGDDILTDTFGDDVMKGGPGNDAINGGSGPFDLLQGNEGNDFIVGGNDLSEIFGGPGNDIMFMGFGLSESIGGSGDDWIEGTISPASIAIGDNNNQFQNDPDGGNDILVTGPGDMDFDAEGGDDIMVGKVVPTHRFEGMLGFDWVTYRGELVRVDADMLLTGAVVINPALNEGRDRYDLVEALSGTNFDDLIGGDNRVAADLFNDGLNEVNNAHVLSAAGIARVTGLAALLPAGATSWGEGNILLGGPGSDRIEGRGGNDIIDGDAWLNVQLKAPNPAVPGAFLLVDTLQSLKTDVFAGRIKPGDITYVRSIVTTSSAGIDTAVFSGNRAEYTVTNVNGLVTVTHTTPGVVDDGTDTLRNIERLQFADATINTGNNTPTGAPVLTQLRPQEAEPLSVLNGTIADADGIVNGSITVQWQQAASAAGPFANIPGATTRPFTPTQAQVGQVLRAILSFTDGDGHSESVPSAASGIVGDVFDGGAGADTFNGTGGRDLATGGGGNDTLSGGVEDDVIRGQAGIDVIDGGAGIDTLTGGADDDAVNGGDGDDIIRVGADDGFDSVNGGAGVDQILATAANTVIGLSSITAVESINGGGNAGVIVRGTDAANVFNFSAVTLTGVTRVEGGNGADTITGSIGDDTLNGDNGADTISGGQGVDTIRGDAGPDVLNGNQGADDITGGDGDDVIDGGNGADTINGNAGNDTINGGNGDDTINVGAAAGTDVIKFEPGMDTDTINGFGAAAPGQDFLDLSALGITALTFPGATSKADILNNAGVATGTVITIRNAANVVIGTIRLPGVLRNDVTLNGGDFLLAP